MCLKKFVKLTNEITFGYRLFSICTDGKTYSCLQSPVMDNRWESKDLYAEREPKTRNQHGIYSLKTLSDLLKEMCGIFEGYPQVIALVKNSGQTAIHENGYRSHKAEILALTPSVWWSKYDYSKLKYDMFKKNETDLLKTTKLCKEAAEKLGVKYCKYEPDLEKFKRKV